MSRYGPRIAALHRRAERDRRAVEAAPAERTDATPSASAVPNGTDEAETYLREGVGPAVWCYVEARTGGRRVPFSPAEVDALEEAMNWWLECYARGHDVALEAEFTIREAAELLLETHNVHDVGQLLTGVPPRRDGR